MCMYCIHLWISLYFKPDYMLHNPPAPVVTSVAYHAWLQMQWYTTAGVKLVELYYKCNCTISVSAISKGDVVAGISISMLLYKLQLTLGPLGPSCPGGPAAPLFPCCVCVRVCVCVCVHVVSVEDKEWKLVNFTINVFRKSQHTWTLYIICWSSLAVLFFFQTKMYSFITIPLTVYPLPFAKIF